MVIRTVYGDLHLLPEAESTDSTYRGRTAGWMSDVLHFSVLLCQRIYAQF